MSFDIHTISCYFKKKMSHVAKPKAPNAVCVYDFTAAADKNTKESIIDWLEKYTKKWSFQLEKGEGDYTHFQGRFSLKIKLRPQQVHVLARDNDFVTHMTTTSTENHKNDFYTTKEETRIEGPWSDIQNARDKMVPSHLKDEPKWWPWQQQVLDSIKIKDNRTVDVVVDDGLGTTQDNGGKMGKSTLSLWLGCRGLARRVPIQKEARDISRMVMCCDVTPIYFIDLPRGTSHTCQNAMYSAIEEIKNGYAYDDRYSFKEKYFDPPRVWVFTNSMPDMSLLSKDRWRIWKYNKQTKTLYQIPEGTIFPQDVKTKTTLKLVLVPKVTHTS